MLVLWLIDLGVTYESQFLILACNFVFSTLASGFMAYLAGRSFLVRGSPSVLLLGCGVLAWGAAGVVANFTSRGDANLDVTIHNSGVLISAMLHLVGAILLLQPAYRVRAPGLWLAAGYLGSIGAVGLGAIWAVAGHAPVFFVPGAGGTPVRQFVLGSAMGMFLLAAALIATASRGTRSAFPQWYVGALGAIAVGLLGILLQSTIGGLVAWAGRTAIWLGGVYMVLAALASAQEMSAWGTGLEEALRESEELFVKAFRSSPAALVISRLNDGRLVDVNEAFARLHGYSPAELIGRKSHEVGLVSLEERTALAGDLVSRDQMHERELLLRGKDGQARWVVASAECVQVAGESCILWTGFDVTERKRAEERIAADLEAMTRLQKLGTLFVREGNLEKVLGEIVETAMAICGADFGNVQLLEEATGTLRIAAHRGFPQWWLDYWQMVHVGQGTCGTALMRGERVIVEDMEKSTIFSGTALEVQLKAGVRAVQSTPLVSRSGKPLGMFATHWKMPKRPDERALKLLDLLSQQAADIVERAQNEAALRKKDAELALMLRSTPFMLTRCSRDLRYLFVSHAYAEMIGRRPEEIEGKPIVSIMGERGFETIRPHVEAVLRGERVGYEEGIEFPGVGVRQLSVVYVPDRDGDGRVIGWLASIVDVTERNRTRQALAEAEERMRLAVDGAAIGTWDFNTVTGEVVWSDRCKAMFGLTPEARVDYQFFIERLHPEDRRRVDEAVRRATDPDGRGQFEEVYRACWPDGTQRSILSVGRASFSAIGTERRALRFMGIALDLTERKRAEEALRTASQRLAYHVQNTPLAVIEFDAELRVCAWSDGAERMFGWKASEVEGQPMWEIPWIFEEDREKMKKVSAGLLTGETVRSVSSNRNLRKDGKVIWCEWYNSGLTDKGGKMRSIQCLVLDMTQRKEAEAVLARDKEQLEGLVAERTTRLQELVGELEHFSYTITHDLRAPLRAMRGYGEIVSLMCEESGQKEPQEFLRKISTSAERMDRLITDALNYSRSVRQELPLEDVDSGQLLRGMLDTYPELQASKARITVAGNLPIVLGNEAGLTQCFSNLLGNAVKFVNPGQMPVIRIWGEERDGWARIWVEDKGIGISPEMLPRVFDMFSRGSNNYEGTGIGLALVRKVSQRMGGRVGVESQDGKGSRFWIELKRSEAKARGGPAAACAVGGGGGGTVLYVEDDENDAQFMKRAFKGKGLEGSLRLVGDGRAAIDYLSGMGMYGDRDKYPVPSLVLLDLNLPEVPGFGVLQWMRNSPDYLRTPVVVFSSSTRAEDRSKAQELGANEFVTKPSSGITFGDVVERLKERWLAEGKADVGGGERAC
jgi:PAS domain S-box-containing protein